MNKKDLKFFLGACDDDDYDFGDGWTIHLDTWSISSQEVLQLHLYDSMVVFTKAIADGKYKDIAIPYNLIRFAEFEWED